MTQATMSETTVSNNCFALIANEDPLVVKPVTCAADTTIKSPNAKIPSEVIKKEMKMDFGVFNIYKNFRTASAN